MFKGEVLCLFNALLVNEPMPRIGMGVGAWSHACGHPQVFLHEYNYDLCIFFKLRLAAECVIGLSLSFIGLTSAMCFLSYKKQLKQFSG